MTIFAIRKPDGSVLPAAEPSMKAAQDRIAELEPDVLLQAKWQIHPISSRRDAEAARIDMHWTLTVEKFDGATGELVETVEREGVN